MDPTVSTLARGDAEVVAVRLDTNEAAQECVNAVEGVLQLSGPVSAVDVSLGNSIFSIWVEPPTISPDGRQVTFAGGVPNGYCGRIDGDPRLTNNLFDVIVRTTAIASNDGSTVTGQINFTEQTVAYLNDGFGTKAELQVFPKEFSVLPELSSDVLDPWKDLVAADTISPQEFSISLEQTSPSLRDRYYITFSTTDKQTGLDRYEVMEEPLSLLSSFTWGGANKPWIETRSPYVLKDQKLNSIIRVKAVDKAGNEYIATYVPDEELRSTSLTTIILLALLGVSVLLLLFGSVRFYQTRRRKSEQVVQQQSANIDTDVQPTDTDQSSDAQTTHNEYDKLN
jgi:hypothetical protein